MSTPTTANFSGYLPAIFKESNCRSYIEYYVLNPATGVMHRKQIRTDRIRKRFPRKRDFMIYVAGMVSNINMKLASGYNPFITSENARHYERLESVLLLYLQEKERETRPDTMRSYRSFVNRVIKWIASNRPGIYAADFGKLCAVEYIDTWYNTSKASTRTYNNMVKGYRTIWSWLVEKNYAASNPFNDIKLKKKTEKKRELVTPEERRQISTYFDALNQGMLLVCKLVYYSLIRPKEIRMIRVRDVHVAEGYITVDGDVAKNHHTRYAAINQDIVNTMLAIGIDQAKPDDYLIGRDFTPCPTISVERQYMRQFTKARSALRLKDTVQLYGLRDTGITDLLHAGVDPLTVQKLADHSSLDITSIYTRHSDPALVSRIQNSGIMF